MQSIPPNHQTVMPYLIVADPKALIDFAVTVFQAELTFERYRENEMLMHGELRVGTSTLMLAQSTAEWTPMPTGLFIYSADVDAAFQKALELGAKVIMPLEDKDYGRTCCVEDTNGIVWWITSPH